MFMTNPEGSATVQKWIKTGPVSTALKNKNFDALLTFLFL